MPPTVYEPSVQRIVDVRIQRKWKKKRGLEKKTKWIMLSQGNILPSYMKKCVFCDRQYWVHLFNTLPHNLWENTHSYVSSNTYIYGWVLFLGLDLLDFQPPCTGGGLFFFFFFFCGLITSTTSLLNSLLYQESIYSSLGANSFHLEQTRFQKGSKTMLKELLPLKVSTSLNPFSPADKTR